MIIISLISWLLYGYALVLKGRANRIRFMSPHDMPLSFSSSPSYASSFWLKRLVITYGSLVGIAIAHGMSLGIGAFIFYLVISAITFFRGSRAAVNKWAKIDFQRQEQAASLAGIAFDENIAWRTAQKTGESLVEENISRNGNL